VGDTETVLECCNDPQQAADVAEGELLGAARALTPQSRSDDISALVQRVAEARFSFTIKSRVLAAIKRSTKAPLGDLRREYSEHERETIRRHRKKQRQLAGDRHPTYPEPRANGEVLPQIDILNRVLGTSIAPEPPMRDTDWHLTAVHVRATPGLHTLTSATSNAEGADPPLPAPVQPLLARLTDMEAAEEIGRHIAYEDPSGDLVSLPSRFVRHYMRRHGDKALPIVKAVAVLPLVRPDGSLLAANGLHRETGFVFRIPQALSA
jgi:hypothetical protein